MDRSKLSKRNPIIFALICLAILISLVPNFAANENNLAFANSKGAGLYTFGNNAHGATGLGTDSGSTTVPAPVGEQLDWTQVSAGGRFFTIAINQKGELYAWGRNEGGQTGLGLSSGNTFEPTLVCNKRNWTHIAAGWDHSLGIADGKLYAWGYNTTGQTGLATVTGNTLVPTLVDDTETWTHIAAGGNETTGHSLAITSNGDLYSWGSNQHGRTGFGTTLGNVNIPLMLSNSHTWTQVAAGSTHSLALTSKGELYAWGNNANGMTGLNRSDGSTLTPTLVSSSRKWTDIATGQIHSLAVTDQGELYAWGHNLNGATGLGTETGNTIVPTLVNNTETWVQVCAVPGRNSSGAVTSDKRIFMWGLGEAGRLGTGDSQNRLRPTHIATVTDLLSFSGGGTHSFIIAETVTLTGEEKPIRPTIPATPVELSKTLQLNSGVTIPDLDFSFDFKPERIALTSGADGSLLYSVDHALAIPTQTLNISGSNYKDLQEFQGAVSLTQSINLAEMLYGINFPHEGIYVWLVSEVPGSSNTAAPACVDYSPAQYELRVQVDRSRTIEVIEFAAKVTDNDEQELGSKSEGAHFTNTYTKQIGEEGHTGTNALEVSKTIPSNEVNQFADLTTSFKFNLTLQKVAFTSDIAPQVDFPMTACIVDSTTETYLRDEVISDISHDFDLRHNEKLLIPTLPAGSSFEVREFPDLNFASSFKVYLEDGSVVTGSEHPGVAISTGTHFILESGKSLAEFTNNFNFVPPTGFALAHFPYAVLASFALLLILSAIALKRRTIERLTMLN